MRTKKIPAEAFPEPARNMDLSTASTAPDWDTAEGIFRVVHPFHPLCGQQLALVTIRRYWGDNRIYYHDPEGRLASIPTAWTDVVSPDPFVVLSAGRSPFRVEDLLELVRLLEGLREEGNHDQ